MSGPSLVERLCEHRAFRDSSALRNEAATALMDAQVRITALEADLARYAADNADLRTEAKTARELMYAAQEERDRASRDYAELRNTYDRVVAHRDALKTALQEAYERVASRDNQGKIVPPREYANFEPEAIDKFWDHDDRHLAHRIACALSPPEGTGT